MNEKRNLQHAMLSFALLGGLLVSSRNTNGAADRAVSHPSNFVPVEGEKRR